MSYDLFLWREQPGAKIDPGQLLRELKDTVQFPGIIGIPLTTIGEAFMQQFPDIEDGGHELDWEGDGSYFQVGFTFLDERTASLIVLNCGYELLKSPQAFERIQAVAAALGCRVFNPQEPAPKASIFKRWFGQRGEFLVRASLPRLLRFLRPPPHVVGYGFQFGLERILALPFEKKNLFLQFLGRQWIRGVNFCFAKY